MESFLAKPDAAKALEPSNRTSDKPGPSEAERKPDIKLGRLVSCPLDHLRPHPGYIRHHLTVPAYQLSALVSLGDLAFQDPLLITRDGVILDGYARWELARKQGRSTLLCIEYELTEAEALHRLLQRHRRSNGLNDFSRILLALELEPWFKEKARANQQAGGQGKGSAKLPEAQHIDVRQEIARAAGVGARNVSNVRTILQTAHPRLIEALRDGTLTINRAIRWCRQPRAQQVEQFTQYRLERETSKVIRQSIARLKKDKTSPDPITVLNALQQQEARQPGSVVVRVGRLQHTVVLIGQDLLTGPNSQGVLQLK